MLPAGWDPASILPLVSGFHNKGPVKKAFAHEVKDTIGPMVADATGREGHEFWRQMEPMDLLQEFYNHCLDVPAVLALASPSRAPGGLAGGEEHTVLLRVSENLSEHVLNYTTEDTAGGHPVQLTHGPCSVEEQAAMPKSRQLALHRDVSLDDRRYFPLGWQGQDCYSPPGTKADTQSYFISGCLYSVDTVMWSFTSDAKDNRGQPCVHLRFLCFQDQVTGAVQWYPGQNGADNLYGGLTINPSSVSGVTDAVWGFTITGKKWRSSAEPRRVRTRKR